MKELSKTLWGCVWVVCFGVPTVLMMLRSSGQSLDDQND